MSILPLRREHPTLCQRNWRARITLIRSLHQYYDYRWLLLSLIDNSKIGTFQIGNYDAVLVPLGILQCRRQSFLDRMRGNMSPEFFPPKVSSGTTVRARFLLSTTLPPLWQRRLGPRKYLLMASAMSMAFIGMRVKNEAAATLGNVMAQLASPWWLSAPAGRDRIETILSNHRGCRRTVTDTALFPRG